MKGFRRVFTRYDKLDLMYSPSVLFAMICETLQNSVNTTRGEVYIYIHCK